MSRHSLSRFVNPLNELTGEEDAQVSAGLNPTLDPYPALGKPRLTFKSDGTFKITVFSDLHFGENPWDAWGPEQDINSTVLMNTVLGDEKPDYVYVDLSSKVNITVLTDSFITVLLTGI